MAKITLAAARVNAGMTQQDVADAMKVSRQTVIDWESGRRAIRTPYLYMFCRLTGFTEDDILLPEKST